MSPSPLVALAEAAAAVHADDVRALTAAQRKARLVTLRSTIDALELTFDETVAVSDAAGDGQVLDGATSTAAWLRHTLRMAPREASMHVRTARMRAHDPASDVAAAAVVDGTITYGHLQAITSALHDLTASDDSPESEGSADHRRAVHLLVDLAAQVDPAQLRAAGRHLRYVLDPDRGLADHDRQTRARRASLAPLLDGSWRLELLTTAEGGALLTQLFAATGAPTSADDQRTANQRRHDSLLDALRVAAESDALPVFGGLSPRVLITAPPEAFLATGAPPERLEATSDIASSPSDHWRPASFAGGSPVPSAVFDELICNPTLVRVLQAPTGAVLDVGRAHRFFTAAQRTALWVRDRGCRFPGCAAPWTHAHHVTPWQRGGTTDLANGLLLCSHHHRAVHGNAWVITTGPNGADDTVTFTHRSRLTVHHSALPPPDPLSARWR